MSNPLNYFLKINEDNSFYYLRGGNVMYFSLMVPLLQISYMEVNSAC